MSYDTHVLALEPAAGCTRTSIFILLFIPFSHIRLMECTIRLVRPDKVPIL